VYWNAKSEVVMPYFDLNGEITGYEKVQIGDV
jgi:hypothetical protein